MDAAKPTRATVKDTVNDCERLSDGSAVSERWRTHPG
jgi:hypothetical protein